MNRVEEARATINSVLQRKGLTCQLPRVAGFARLGPGQENDIENELQKAAGTPEGELAFSNSGAVWRMVRGQMRQAREFARQAGEALDRFHLQGRAGIETQLASSEALVGNQAEALKDTAEALQLSRTLNVIGQAGITYAILHQDQKALALADEIQRTHPNETIAVNVTVPIIRAVAALSPPNQRQARSRQGSRFPEYSGSVRSRGLGYFLCAGPCLRTGGAVLRSAAGFSEGFGFHIPRRPGPGALHRSIAIGPGIAERGRHPEGAHRLSELPRRMEGRGPGRSAAKRSQSGIRKAAIDVV
jgi:ElaB/YqjD/DUF883 family membrane-anchored ribosome-binding protein